MWNLLESLTTSCPSTDSDMEPRTTAFSGIPNASASESDSDGDGKVLWANGPCEIWKLMLAENCTSAPYLHRVQGMHVVQLPPKGGAPLPAHETPIEPHHQRYGNGLKFGGGVDPPTHQQNQTR